jgi:hypothetical protein
MKLLGTTSMGFLHSRSSTDQIFCIHQRPEKKWEYNEAVHQLFIDFKKAMIQLGGRYCNILIEFEVPMKLVKLIKMCLNETYSNVHIGKHMSDNFPIQNGLKQRDALLPLLSKFCFKHAIRMCRKTR